MAKRKKRKVPALNSSSTADIAFLLLIFFLVTSSMEVDTGIQRRLPKLPEQNEKTEAKIERRNMLRVYINQFNQVQIGDVTYNSIEELSGGNGKRNAVDVVKEFVLNTGNNPQLPELIEGDFPAPVGHILYTKNHIISLTSDKTTSYQAYLSVQDRLVKAYNELRNEAAKKYYGLPFSELQEDQQEVIKKIYRQAISEAEPKNYAEKK